MLKPTSVIISSLGLEPNSKAQLYFTNLCKNHMDRFVPMRDKNLRRTAYIVNTNEIHYPQQYAYYQYKGVRDDGTHRVYNYTTPGTGIPGQGSYWDKRMWSADKEKIEKSLANYIRSSK